MLSKSLNILRSAYVSTQDKATLKLLGCRSFSRGHVFQSGEGFNFPKHKEFFNDEYYDDDSNESPYAKKAVGPKGGPQEDYVDPNNPFVTENPFVPGGILASYKKRLGLTAEEVMQQNYWDKVRDLADNTAQYFDVVGKSDRDIMNQTKNYTTRLRLQREVDFTEDYRKRFMTREYGNYQKYEEGKNKVEEVTEKGQDDFGYDLLMKRQREMDLRLNTEEG